ncbi:unnamed protein product [Sphagnum troendelagicum]|uniref:Uncharacterized protein n=1 Tax=Sphagnum troendelagicum TaxID=128251 RepID=A0ABP0ULF9_9BRYO
MAGLALAIQLLEKSSSGVSSKSLHSFSTLAAVSAAAAASSAISYLPDRPSLTYTPTTTSREWSENVAYCEEAVDPDRWDARRVPLWETRTVIHVKTYEIELKPLFSAFRIRALGATTVRALLVNYLPLLEAYLQPEEDEGDEDADRPAQLPVNPIVPLKRSATHIVREVSVITTRRILERAVVHYVTHRMAWKLLKDIPKSAVRKAARNMSKWQLFIAVCKTTFRAHALGVAANWMVQLVLDIYRSISASLYVRTKDGKPVGLDARELKRLARRTVGNTLKGIASLLLASLGAGLGTVLIRPSTGTWIGCAVGDFAGPFLVGIWLDTWIVYGTFTPGGDRGQ